MCLGMAFLGIDFRTVNFELVVLLMLEAKGVEVFPKTCVDG